MGEVAWVLAAALVGAAAGVGIRHLLGVLRRGTTVRVGLAEAFGAVVLAAGAAASQHTPAVGAVTLAGLMLVALGLVDTAEHRLPDALTWPSLVLAAGTVALTALLAPHSGSLPRAALVGAVLFALFGLVHLVSSRSMGRGDVKLVPSLGLLTGYFSVPVTALALVVAFLSGAIVAVAGLLIRRLSLRSALPFGPFLLWGTWLSLAFPALSQALTVS